MVAKDGKEPLRLSDPVAAKMLAYSWPGNVRELENCLERAAALARFDVLSLEDLPEKIRAYKVDRFTLSAYDPTEIVTLDELEHRYVERVISLVGNKTKVAELLGIDRRTLYRKLDRWGIAHDP